MFALNFTSSFIDHKQVVTLQANLQNEEKISVRTSGSTGRPKDISIATQFMKASARMTNKYFNFNESTSALLALSLDTIAGKMMLLRAMEGNYNLSLTLPKLRPLEDFNEALDFIAMVPAQLMATLSHDLDKLKSISVILIGGGPISVELEQELRNHEKTVYHSYGMTETITHVAMRKVGFNTEATFEALPGVIFHVSSDKLIIHAPHIGVDNLLTNDVVELISPTQFIWRGRADFVVNSGGYKIQLEELETKMSSSIHSPFFLWKQTSEKWGEELVLCLEDEKINPVDYTSLELNSWEKPKKIFYFKNFIRSESGKIMRKSTFELNPIQVREKTL